MPRPDTIAPITTPYDPQLGAALGMSANQLAQARGEILASLRRSLIRRGYTCAATLDGWALLGFACDMHDALAETAARLEK